MKRLISTSWYVEQYIDIVLFTSLKLLNVFFVVKHFFKFVQRKEIMKINDKDNFLVFENYMNDTLTICRMTLYNQSKLKKAFVSTNPLMRYHDLRTL